MESNLKSNEIRLPKNEKKPNGKNAFSKSFNYIKFNNHFNNISKSNKIKKIQQQQQQLQQECPSIDFDLNTSTQYFKSSFARSLSTEQATKSLDFNINFNLNSSFNSLNLYDPDDNEEDNTFNNSASFTTIETSSLIDDMMEINNKSPMPPPLPLTKPPNLDKIKLINNNQQNCIHNNNINNNINNNNHNINNKNYNNNNNNNINSNNNNKMLHNDGPSSLITSSTSSNGLIDNNNVIRNKNRDKIIWSNASSTARKLNHNRKSLDSSEIELLRLRKESQNLIENNRRLMSLSAVDPTVENLIIPGNSSNIEAVILQTKVDTLQWQLKQVETSRQMYRAVMNETVKFLERCHRNLESLQFEDKMGRSKSIHHVFQNDFNDLSDSSRARSSTNIIETSPKGKNKDEPNSSSNAINYNNFRDFTWRRSPKKSTAALKKETEAAKMSQEAFRLLRTVQNLLNTREPDLSQSSKILQEDNNFSLPPPQFRDDNSSIIEQTASIKSSNGFFTPPTAFSRDIQARESRLSLRSSTDSSVHSTSSSSKNETDEDHTTVVSRINKNTIFATTEDESGFSSISSFQEIGLPLHSTMISLSQSTSINTSSNNSDSSSDLNVDTILESKNSTLKGSVNGIGLPTVINHKRWDSAPAVPPRNHRLSAISTDENPNVLWV